MGKDSVVELSVDARVIRSTPKALLVDMPERSGEHCAPLSQIKEDVIAARKQATKDYWLEP